MMEDDAIASWRTLDLTPLAGYEWLMSGASTMRQSDLPDALRLASRLFDVSLQRLESEEVQQKLWQYLNITQGVPVALGSGRSSLRYKMHASCHSTKEMHFQNQFDSGPVQLGTPPPITTSLATLLCSISFHQGSFCGQSQITRGRFGGN